MNQVHATDGAEDGHSSRTPPVGNDVARRRRNSKSHERILEATIRLLGLDSYPSLTMENIAAEAGVGKGTLYRWWKSKGALVGEALAWHLSPSAGPRTDSIRDDLRETVQSTVRNYSGGLAGFVVPSLAADITHDPDLRKTFFAQFLEPRRAVARRPIDRAIEAGLLPEDLDVDLIMDMWAGAIFYRVLMSDRPVDNHFADQITRLLLDLELPRILTT